MALIAEDVVAEVADAAAVARGRRGLAATAAAGREQARHGRRREGESSSAHLFPFRLAVSRRCGFRLEPHRRPVASAYCRPSGGSVTGEARRATSRVAVVGCTPAVTLESPTVVIAGRRRPAEVARGTAQSTRSLGSLCRPPTSTRSSTCASDGASSTPRPRSTAASAPPTTTARSARSCSATSRTPGSARWSSAATTWSSSMPPSSARPPSGRPPGTWRRSRTPWSTARSAGAGFREDDLPDPDVCPSCGAKGSFTEARAFNLMFKTYAGPGRGCRRRGLPAAGDGAGHVRQLRERAADEPEEAALRIAQVGKSFRNEITTGNFIFRTREFEQMEMEYFVPARDRDQVVRVLVRGALQLVRRPRDPETEHPASARATTEESWPTTRPGPRTWSSASPWAGRSWRASPTATDFDLTAALQVQRQEPGVLRRGPRPALRALRRRARGRGRPLHGRRSCSTPTTRTRSAARRASCCGSTPRLAPYQGRGAPAVPQGDAAAHGPRGAPPARERLMIQYDDTQSHRPPLPPPGRGRHAVLRHRRLRDARRPGRHHPRARHHPAGPAPPRHAGGRAVGSPRAVARGAGAGPSWAAPPPPQQGRDTKWLSANQRGKARTSGHGPSSVRCPDRMAASHVLRPAHTLWNSERSAVTWRSAANPSSRSHTVEPAGSRTSQTVRPRRARSGSRTGRPSGGQAARPGRGPG